MAARFEVVQLPQLLGEEAGASARTQQLAGHCGDLVRYASQLAPGQVRATPVPCRHRPERRACPGLLVVARQAPEDHVEWQCPSCLAAGVITVWQGTKADLRAMRRSPQQDFFEVPVPIAALGALREIARDDRDLGRLAFTAQIDSSGQPVLLVRDSEAAQFVTRLTIEAMAMKSRQTIGRLMAIAEAIADAAEDDDDLDDLDDVVDDDLADIFGVVMDGARAPAARPVPHGGRGRRPHARAKRSRPQLTFQIKVTLRDVRPPIWRRLLVPSDILLPGLHDVLQIAMGWRDSHLHLFRVQDVCYAPPGDWDGEDSTDVALVDLAPQPGARLVYEYDFGDGWTHDILVEKVLPIRCEGPRCTNGRRRCPPEDCGGPAGYEELVAALADPEHESHDELLEWCGGAFDPAEFDARRVDAALRTRIV